MKNEENHTVSWTEKYRPKRLSQIIGNEKAIQEIKSWARLWLSGVPKKRALILYGPPGVGKTSAALALANKMGWRVMELNASDIRNQENIKKVSGATLYESFSDEGEMTLVRKGQRTLLIFDEADNLYERKGGTEEEAEYRDTGGKEEIVKTVINTRQPVILIANDYYQLIKNTPLKEYTKPVQFKKLSWISIKALLRRISEKEELSVTDDALTLIAKSSDGDFRAALNDLQSTAQLGVRITAQLVEDLGKRDTKVTIFNALDKIFDAEDPLKAREITYQLDESPDHLLLWLDENLPKRFKNPEELLRGFDALGKADLFLGRVYKRQSYKLWAYAYDLMTMGVNTARRKKISGYGNMPYGHRLPYGFPSYLKRMAATKEERSLKRSVLKKVAAYCHTSTRVAEESIFPHLSNMLKYILNPEKSEEDESRKRIEVVAEFIKQLHLNEKETSVLLSLPSRHALIKEIFLFLNKVKKPPVKKKEEEEKDNGELKNRTQMSLDAWG